MFPSKDIPMNSTIKNVLQFSILFLYIVLISCSEQERVIEPFVPSGNRVVLIEEFTGKGCTNCPKGSRELDNLLLQFPDNLVAVSIHAGFFANPQFFPLGVYDFRTDEGEFLYDYLGPNFGYPAGVVDRTPFGGELQISLNQWASAISSEIQVAPAVDIVVERTYDEETRLLTVTVSGIGKENVTGEIRVSVMLTETGIVDAQDDQEAGGIVEDYVHKHVLRDMLTPAAGAPLFSDGISSGQSFNATYSSTLNTAWIADSMEIVAFVSAVNGANFPVLQAASTHVTD